MHCQRSAASEKKLEPRVHFDDLDWCNVGGSWKSTTSTSNIFVTGMEKCDRYDVRAVDFALALRPGHTFAKSDIEGSEMPILAQTPVRDGRH